MSIKSIVTQIKETISQLDELLGSTDLKDGKRADILMERSRLLTSLLAQENTDRQNTGELKIAQLTEQHNAHAHRISELQTENRNLRSKPAEVIREKDPEAEGIREQNVALTSIIKLLVRDMTEEECAVHAIRAIQTLSPDAARRLCELARGNYREYAQMSRYSDGELQDVIARAQIDGPAVIFARAALGLRGVKVKSAEDWL